MFSPKCLHFFLHSHIGGIGVTQSYIDNCPGSCLTLLSIMITFLALLSVIFKKADF